MVWICAWRFNRRPPLKTKATARTARVFARTLKSHSDGRYFFRLYVAGATDRSRQALRHVTRLCEAEFKGNYKLEVIDVYQRPELAREDQIVATPTLVKKQPRPVRRFIGSLQSISGLFDGMDLASGGEVPA